MLTLIEGRVSGDDVGGSVSRDVQQVFISLQVGEGELRETVLAGAEEFTEATQLKVGPGDLEPVVCGGEDDESFGCFSAAVDDDAVALLSAAAYASA